MLKKGVSSKALKEFVRIFPITWSHLIFTGRYNFMNSNGKIDIELFEARLEKLGQEQFPSKRSVVV